MASPVHAWRPGVKESFRLAWKPMLSYMLFNVTGFFCFMVAILWYERGSDRWQVIPAVIAGIVGVAVGQLVALLRFKLLPIFLLGIATIVVGFWITVGGLMSGIPPVFAICFFFFAFAFPCGLLALQHRYELLSVFWPSVGWVGSVMIILNEEGRAARWEEDKLSAWLPIPLVILFGFLFFLVWFFVSKQAMRAQLWQSLSGAAERRVSKKTSVSLVPRRNILPLIIVVGILFAFVAVLAPYMWRTGKGEKKTDKQGAHSKEGDDEQQDGKSKRPPMNGESLQKLAEAMANGAKKASPALWPLLGLILLYRPAKRAFLLTHLRAPVFPTPPSERIDNLWEYVRIGAEDAGISPAASDSVEDMMKRVSEKRPMSPAIATASQIYARSRYGLSIQRGDALAMRAPAEQAYKDLRSELSLWDKIVCWWRPLR